MYKIILLVGFSVLINTVNAQTFEGKIQYISLYLDHKTIANVFIKDNKCRTKRYLDDIPLTGYTMNLGSNWYRISDLQELIKNEKTKKVNGNIKLMKNKNKELILGYTCTLYKEKRNTPYGKDIMIYYIADSLKANNQNGSGNVRNGRIVLKSIQKIEGGTYETEAIDIKEMKLDDKFFELPDYPIKEVDFEKLSKQYVR